MPSNAPAAKSGLYADPREDWLALHKSSILRVRLSIPIIISGIAAVSAI